MCLGVLNCFPLFLSSVQLETLFHKDYFFKSWLLAWRSLEIMYRTFLTKYAPLSFPSPTSFFIAYPLLIIVINIFSFVRLARLLVRRRRPWINWKSISQSLAWRRTTRRKLGQRRVGITFWHCSIPLNVMVRVLLSFFCDED